MFESILHGVVVGLIWVGVWRFFDLVSDIRKISRTLEELADVMRSYQTDLSRFDLLLFDLISEVAGDKVDPSFVERERDDFYRYFSVKEELDDEA